MTSIPEKVVNYNVYDKGQVLVGVSGEITMPNLEAMSETISGAGIAGEIDMPTIGHFGSLTMEIPFRTLYKKSFSLLDPSARTITLRASQESFNVTEGELKHEALKITIKGMPKGLDFGTLGVGKATESKNTMEILYLKVELDSEVVLELDKLNFIFKVNDTDILADIRDQI